MTRNNAGVTWQRLTALAVLLVAVALLAGASHSHRSRIRTQATSEALEPSVSVVPLTLDECERIAGEPPMAALGYAHTR